MWALKEANLSSLTMHLRLERLLPINWLNCCYLIAVKISSVGLASLEISSLSYFTSFLISQHFVEDQQRNMHHVENCKHETYTQRLKPSCFREKWYLHNSQETRIARFVKLYNLTSQPYISFMKP